MREDSARRYVSRRAVCGRAAGVLLGMSATAAGTSGSCSGGSRQVVVVPRVVQLMAPGVVVPLVGSPVHRHPAYEQVEGPPLLEPVE